MNAQQLQLRQLNRAPFATSMHPSAASLAASNAAFKASLHNGTFPVAEGAPTRTVRRHKD